MTAKFFPLVPLLILSSQVTPAVAHTDEGCSAFTWDVSRELAAMRGPAKESATGASILIGEHYALVPSPQAQVKFVVAPEREAKTATPRAAVVRFEVPRPGRYRVSITSRHWIDVVADGRAIKSTGHEGRSGCEVLHKVVEFELPAGRMYLQLSGQDEGKVGLVITEVS